MGRRAGVCNELPRDGKTAGELMVRGHWVTDRYYRQTTGPLTDGWFPTGDVAHLDQDGLIERPLVVVVRKAAQHVSREEILAQYEGKVARFCIPDDVVFMNELTHTATGKVSKSRLREQLRDWTWAPSEKAESS